MTADGLLPPTAPPAAWWGGKQVHVCQRHQGLSQDCKDNTVIACATAATCRCGRRHNQRRPAQQPYLASGTSRWISWYASSRDRKEVKKSFRSSWSICGPVPARHVTEAPTQAWMSHAGTSRSLSGRRQVISHRLLAERACSADARSSQGALVYKESTTFTLSTVMRCPHGPL